jgi:hypothetical protein
MYHFLLPPGLVSYCSGEKADMVYTSLYKALKLDSWALVVSQIAILR